MKHLFDNIDNIYNRFEIVYIMVLTSVYLIMRVAAIVAWQWR